jgi:pantetheine-phosphate adenylyltransferase
MYGKREEYMRKAIYPGSFDPITLGHIDIIKRAMNIFDKLIVAIGVNPEKRVLFTIEERLDLARESCREFENVEVVSFSGLVSEFAKAAGAIAIIRGLRAVSDFEYEFQMALANRKLAPNIETVFLMPSQRYIYLNSTLVKTIARFGGCLADFVPPCVEKKLKEKFSQ